MNGFNRVSYKTRVFERDFKSENELSAYATFSKTSFSAAGITPVKVYEVGGEIYIYCTDKNLRKKSNSVFLSTGFSSSVVPLIVPIILNGTKQTLFIGTTAAIEGGSTVSGVPYGASCAECAGRLFITDGSKIKYSEEFDFTDFSVGLDFGGFIELNGEDGDALFVAEDAGNLYVIAKHAAYILKPYGEQFEFTMEKLSAFSLDVKENTVCQIGNRICFLSGNDLCVMSGGKIKRVGTALYGLSTYTYAIAGGIDGLYVLAVNSGGKKYAYVYDTIGEKEVLQDAGVFSVFGGYAKKSGDNYLYKLTLKSDASARVKSYGGNYDFGSCAKKSVCKVEAHIKGSAEIVVSGDGIYRAAITENCNSVSCFVHGRLFNISFENASSDFKLSKLAISYVIHGE